MNAKVGRNQLKFMSILRAVDVPRGTTLLLCWHLVSMYGPRFRSVPTIVGQPNYSWDPMVCHHLQWNYAVLLDCCWFGGRVSVGWMWWETIYSSQVFLKYWPKTYCVSCMSPVLSREKLERIDNYFRGPLGPIVFKYITLAIQASFGRSQCNT